MMASSAFLIHFADKIVKALVFDRERIEVVGGAVDDLTGAARGLDRGVEHGMHGLSWESLMNKTLSVSPLF